MMADQSKIDWDFHRLSHEELSKRFKTNIKTGLTNAQALEGNVLYGANTVTPPPTTSEWKKLWSCLLTGHSVPLLGLGAVPCFVAYSKGFGINNLYLGAGISSVVTVTGVYSYYQHFKTNNLIESMKATVSQYVICVRDGEKYPVRKEDLTLGDIVQITRGDIVPADIVILESNGLKVDNSKFTPTEEHFNEDHENERCYAQCYVCAQPRSPECSHMSHLETKNVVFGSTRVVEGSGMGMVVKIGDDTELAKIPDIPRCTKKRWNCDTDIAREKRDADNKRVTDNTRVNRFIFLVSSGGLSILAQKYRWLYPVIFGLYLIPTSMYASYNAAIRAAFSHLASCNCLVKDVDALGKLGSFSEMYTSLTGTLTQNRLAVNHIWINNQIVQLDFWNENEWPITKTSSWKALERAAVLCNNAEFMPGQEGFPTMKKEVIGNTIDEAILKVTELTTGGGVMEYRAKHEKVREIAFNSERKLQLTFHRSEELNEHELLVVAKGAPEMILKACSTVIIDDIEHPIDEEVYRKLLYANHELAGRYGERVIAFCDKIQDTRDHSYSFDDMLKQEHPTLDNVIVWGMKHTCGGFRFVGLMSMTDPPRAAVPDAIAQLKHANKKVIMVTGEQLMTAKAIATSIGLMNEDTIEDIADKKGVDREDIDPREAQAVCIHGEEFRYLDPGELDKILFLHKEIIFGRMTPYQKQVVMKTAKNLGEVVAFTGSDSNDILALEEADLGIAMGICGSEFIKDSADVILLDNNFGSIVSAMKETKNLT